MMIKKRKLKQRQKEELNVALAEKLFNGAQRKARALVEIYFLIFFLFFFLYFCLILYH
jgi:hypothetical protein